MKNYDYKSRGLSIVTSLVLSLLLFSCRNEEVPTLYEFDLKDGSGGFSGTPSILGKKLENPYTVENMRQAYKNLKENLTTASGREASNDNFEITTTHYYVRFLPTDEEQLLELESDTTISLTDVPIDFEEAFVGDYYHDPSVPDSNYTWLYTAVPLEYNFPNTIQYEKLADLFLPPDEDTLSSSGRLVDNDFFELLETEAMRITGNLDEELSAYSEGDYTTFSAARWWPQGRITVLENAINRTVGVAGARVNARKWFVVKHTYTNSGGHFRMGSVSGKIKYSVQFRDNGNFKVKAGNWFWTARHRGQVKYKGTRWNQHFSSGHSQFYAQVQNAAYDYYNDVWRDYGITRPGTVNLSAKYYKQASSQFRIPARYLPFWSTIRITRINSRGNNRGSVGIYATTIHELTHLAHYKLDPAVFTGIERIECEEMFCGKIKFNFRERSMLTESWAEGVETIVTNDRYNKLSPGYFNETETTVKGYNAFRQQETALEMDQYTPIVTDLVDIHNQNKATNGSSRPVDNVSGYSLSRIEDAVEGCRNIEAWRQNLGDSDSLNELWSYFRQVRDNRRKGNSILKRNT